MEPFTSTEAARLAALDEYGILHTAPEPAYDEITQLVARLFETPIALVSLVGRDSQWFKSSVGVDVSETTIERSLCKYAISRSYNESVFMIQDAITHPFFKDHPAVAGAPHIRMYAGMPLITRDGYAIGTLCVADTKPRAFSRNQMDTLKTLSRDVMSLIEQRNRCAESKRAAGW